jgi:hypothetical protein
MMDTYIMVFHVIKIHVISKFYRSNFFKILNQIFSNKNDDI